MSATVSEGLHSINEHLREVLARWMAEPSDPNAFQTEALAPLLARLTRASELLNGVVVRNPPDLQLEKEISDYRSNVEKLQELLPLIQSRLLAEKARLESARAHLQAATAWADSRKKLS
jgi:hypothetical protein